MEYYSRCMRRGTIRMHWRAILGLAVIGLTGGCGGGGGTSSSQDPPQSSSVPRLVQTNTFQTTGANFATDTTVQFKAATKAGNPNGIAGLRRGFELHRGIGGKVGAGGLEGIGLDQAGYRRRLRRVLRRARATASAAPAGQADHRQSQNGTPMHSYRPPPHAAGIVLHDWRRCRRAASKWSRR